MQPPLTEWAPTTRLTVSTSTLSLDTLAMPSVSSKPLSLVSQYEITHHVPNTLSNSPLQERKPLSLRVSFSIITSTPSNSALLAWSTSRTRATSWPTHIARAASCWWRITRWLASRMVSFPSTWNPCAAQDTISHLSTSTSSCVIHWIPELLWHLSSCATWSSGRKPPILMLTRKGSFLLHPRTPRPSTTDREEIFISRSHPPTLFDNTPTLLHQPTTYWWCVERLAFTLSWIFEISATLSPFINLSLLSSSGGLSYLLPLFLLLGMRYPPSPNTNTILLGHSPRYIIVYDYMSVYCMFL